MLVFIDLGQHLLPCVPVYFALFHYAEDLCLVEDVVLKRFEGIGHCYIFDLNIYDKQ
jgi:hypothetical protein